MLVKKTIIMLLVFVFSFQVIASGAIIINGKEIKNRDQLHALFSKKLINGKNFDSLYETLSTDYSGDSIIKINHVNLLKAKLGSEYIDAKIQAIMDAAADNPHVILVLE